MDFSLHHRILGFKVYFSFQCIGTAFRQLWKTPVSKGRGERKGQKHFFFLHVQLLSKDPQTGSRHFAHHENCCVLQAPSCPASLKANAAFQAQCKDKTNKLQ